MKTYTLTLLSIGASLGVSAFAAEAASPKGPKTPKTPKHHLTFQQADVDDNEGLDVFEFATTRGPGTPLVEIRRRFLPIDVAGAFEIGGDPIPDGFISLEEWQDYRALEEKPKSTLSRFDLADFDGDGQLTAVELGYLVSPKVRPAKVLRQFNKLDKNQDGYVSRLEFKKSGDVIGS